MEAKDKVEVEVEKKIKVISQMLYVQFESL